MTPAREAIVLPAIFLTVTLFGGLRVSESVRLLPPSLTALVLAGLLLGTLVRSHVLQPLRLMNSLRGPLENVSGGVVLVTLFAASAQAINTVLPERGLLHAAFAIFLFAQLMTLNATTADRVAGLRGLLVLLASLFVLRYIIVEALYAPAGGLLHRVLTTLLSGASLGGIVYEPNAAVTGYVAFLALGLYVLGLVLLPAGTSTALVRRGSDASGLPSTMES